MYDSAVGQFLSEDPIGFDGGDFNVRRYVLNRPTDLTDPEGLAPKGDAIFLPGPSSDGDLGYGRPKRIDVWIPFQESKGMTYYRGTSVTKFVGEAWFRENPDGSVNVCGELWIEEEGGFRWLATPNAAELAMWNLNITKDPEYAEELKQYLTVASYDMVYRGLVDPRGTTRRLGMVGAAPVMARLPDNPGRDAVGPAQPGGRSTRGSSTPRPLGWAGQGSPISAFPQGALRLDRGQVAKHLPNTVQSNRLIKRKGGSAHVFNDKGTMCKVETAIIEKGTYIGEFRDSIRYGLRFEEAIGYRIDATGKKLPLFYGELKLDPSTGLYHIIPRTGPGNE